MSKIKTKFICINCGYNTAKWEGCCPSCKEWNTLEESINYDIKTKKISKNRVAISLKDIYIENEDRYVTEFSEINLLFGGGIVKGSISLIAGEPGIGKSTLLLQICGQLSKNYKILYISGEENESQIKLRANRLRINDEKLLILSEFDMEAIVSVILKEKPDVVVVDSIQTMNLKEVGSISGSVAQIRECTYIFQKIAKSEGISTILVGHVNKEGNIAGPKILEHIVDTVLYFEGDSKNSLRILRVVKNRFGSVNEIAVFDMKKDGLVCVNNPCAMLIKERPKNVSGSSICAIMQGRKPLFAEVQSLVVRSSFGLPRRLSKGLDYNKLIIIIAVLEKRVGFSFQNLDCYVNVVGGIKLEDTACDLAIALSLVAALKNVRIDEKMVVLGEIGLAGEIRSVLGVEKTVLEAEKLGFNKIIVPCGNLKNLKPNNRVKLIGVSSVSAAVKNMFT